jgi:hypothetical protein
MQDAVVIIDGLTKARILSRGPSRAMRVIAEI